MPTKIAWATETWNPMTGCTPVSEGCAHCYAKREAKRFGRSFDVTLHPDRLEIPLRWRRPRMVFVPSMGDLFHEDVPADFIRKVFEVMAQAKNHTFQVLTKRPGRMKAFIGYFYDVCWPSWKAYPLPNVWLGVSVENQARADERIPPLLGTPAAVRFVSCEPLLGPLDLTPWLTLGACGSEYGLCGDNSCRTPALDWVIVGGESGGPPERRLAEQVCSCGDYRSQHRDDGYCRPCHGLHRPPWCRDDCTKFCSAGWEPKPEALEWVRSIRDQCQASGVPFFFKQWGPRAGQGTVLDGREHKEMPEVRA